MLKFFRNIRQNLLLQNKTGKYLKYALGEIVLVVIGILIALQINNWNEQNKADRQENKALVALKDEFEKNIERIQYICEQRNISQTSNREYWNLITNDTISTKSKAKKNPTGSFGGNWAAQNLVLNGLVNSGQIDNIKNDTLKRLLVLWPNRVEFWNDEEIKWSNLKDENQAYLRNKIRRVPPFTSKGKLWQNDAENYTKERESQRALFVNDLEYQNIIATKIHRLYIQSIQCDKIMQEYQIIMAALNAEIKNREIN